MTATTEDAVQPSATVSVDVPVVRRRGRPRDPQADVRILSAAVELILTHGFDAMTVDEVAATAHVGKATVYRRWARKDDLAVAAMQRLYNNEVPLPDTGTIRGDLEEVYASVLVFVNSPAGAAYLRTTIVESVRDERIATLYRNASERVEAQAVEMFARAIARGELRADIDVHWAMQWLTGLLSISVITNRPLPDPSQASELVRMMLEGVGA